MNSDQTTRRLVLFFFLKAETALFWVNKGVLTDFQFSPRSFNLFQLNP
jgi:hypothetical protein